VRLAQAKNVKDRPSVSSDGKDFLVVWDDLRNGKDPSTGSGQGWDVYGARVTGDGKALDADGFLVAGGERNQCRAAAAFSKGNYLVAFLSFEGSGAPGKGGSGYVLRSARISPEGKVLDAAPPALSDTKMSLKMWNPIAATGGDNVLVCAYNGEYGPDYKRIGLSTGTVTMPDGKPVAPVAHMAVLWKDRDPLCLGNRQVHHPVGAVWTGKQFLLGVSSQGAQTGPGKPFYRKDCVAICPTDAQGKETGGPEFVVFAGERLNNSPCVSLAFDGERALLTEDVILSSGKGKGETLLTQVHGCFLSPEGKPLDGGKPFAISGNDAKTYCSQGFAVAGPKGQFLVVYSEARGVDDVKIAARLVK
jgi:hypothetical protein